MASPKARAPEGLAASPMQRASETNYKTITV